VLLAFLLEKCSLIFDDLSVLLANVVGDNLHFGSGLKIDELRTLLEIESEFRRIQNVEYDDIVPPEGEVPQAVHDVLGFVVQVRNDYGDSLAAHPFGRARQRLDEITLLPRPGPFDGVQHRVGVADTSPGRNKFLHLFVERDEPDAVPLLEGKVGKRRREILAILEFQNPPAAISHRPAAIEDQVDAGIRFSLILFYEETIEP